MATKGEGDVKMSLFTTYLAMLRKLDLEDWTNPFVYYVMRNRGNNAVAPDANLLINFKKAVKIHGLREDLWQEYEKNYLAQLERKEAQDWMQKIAEQALWHDVVLVCFEKDHLHCHRSLLAQRIVWLHPAVNYVGELRLK